MADMSFINKDVLFSNDIIEIKRTRFGYMAYPKQDFYIGRAFSLYGEYSYYEVILFQQLIHLGQTVVDVGANIGSHTLAMHHLVGPLGKVYAFEPQRVIFEILAMNMILNQALNVSCFDTPLSAIREKLFLPIVNYAELGNFGAVSMQKNENTESTYSRLLDDYELTACHFIKIDVEGMEREVLRGAQKTIKTYSPFLYVENDRAEHSEALIELLFSMDYQLFWHFPPMYYEQNYFSNKENIYPHMVSINLLGVPKRMNFSCDLVPVENSKDSWEDVVKKLASSQSR